MSDFDLTEAPEGVRRSKSRAAKKDLDETGQAEPAGGIAGALINLQRTAGNAGTAALIEEQTGDEHPVERLLHSDPGAPLESSVRARMERRLGDDFSDVRIHTGAEASRSAEAVEASAYTVGEDVVLRDQVRPDTPEGERTLAHELTHVIQQRSGPVDGKEAAGGIKVSDPSDRFERAAEDVASGATGHASGETAASVQRQMLGTPEELEEEEAQPTVQRQPETVPEEEEEELLP
jgi:hypothetical protein